MIIGIIVLAGVFVAWSFYNYYSAISRGMTREQAMELSQKKIDKLNVTDEHRHNFVIDKDRIIEKNFGWVIPIVSEKYLMTKNPSDLVPGMVPWLIYRSGRVEQNNFSSESPKVSVNYARVEFFWQAVKIPLISIVIVMILMAAGFYWISKK